MTTDKEELRKEFYKWRLSHKGSDLYDWFYSKLEAKDKEIDFQKRGFEQALDQIANEENYVTWSAFESVHFYGTIKWRECNAKATELYADSVARDAVKWIRFEDKKPELGQEIWIVWPSGTIPPEYRKWDSEMMAQDWSDMRWIAIPEYQPK